MKRGIQADQIVNDIADAEEELEFFQEKLKTCDDYEYPLVISEVNRIKEKLHKLRNM